MALPKKEKSWHTLAMSDAPHSALYFTASRDLWHSPDQLARCARDYGLDRAIDVLDVGCGQGHWSRALAPHLRAMATLTGVDAEQAWVDAVVGAWSDSSIRAELRAVRADAMALPFADASFDLVTCQTVLIHVPDVLSVLKEMKRVLRPGGKLFICEPNNLANAMAELAVDPSLPIDDVLEVMRFHLVCQRGKIRLGLGDNSLGERVIGLIAAAGFSLLGARLVEKVHPMVPPYPSAGEKLEIAEQRSFVEAGIAGFPRDVARSYYVAECGSDAGFDALYERALAHDRSILARLDAEGYARAGGSVQYLICAQR